MMDTYVNEFIAFKNKNESKAKKCISYRFPVLSEEEIIDIIHDSYAILYKNISNQKTKGFLYPSFLRICYNLSYKAIKKYGGHILQGITDEEQPHSVSMYQIESILKVCDEQESMVNEKKQLVHDALSEMATRCRELLWSFYADELSWATIAGQYGLKNADTAKSQASRCRQTFKEKYNRLRRQSYGK